MLFETGSFLLHSGSHSQWKINCDALTDDDWRSLADLIAGSFTFGKVIGIPTGGTKLANELKLYRFPGNDITLIVDDVLTTGNSFIEARKQVNGISIGCVIFARGKCPDWVIPIFQLSEQFKGV